MYTTHDTLKLLCRSIINRLENKKIIAFSPQDRGSVVDALFNRVKPSIATEQDIREMALQKMGASQERLADSEFSESEQFKTAKAMVRKSLGDDQLNGFFFKQPLKNVAENVAGYFMECPEIEDVFADDEEVERQVVDIVKKFNPAHMS